MFLWFTLFTHSKAESAMAQQPFEGGEMNVIRSSTLSVSIGHVVSRPLSRCGFARRSFSQGKTGGGGRGGGKMGARASTTKDLLGIAIFGSICAGAGALGVWQIERCVHCKQA